MANVRDGKLIVSAEDGPQVMYIKMKLLALWNLSVNPKTARYCTVCAVLWDHS